MDGNVPPRPSSTSSATSSIKSKGLKRKTLTNIAAENLPSSSEDLKVANAQRQQLVTPEGASRVNFLKDSLKINTSGISSASPPLINRQSP